MMRGEGTTYECGGCDTSVFVLHSDGDREELEGWIQVHDLQKGVVLDVFCPDCDPSENPYLQ